MREIVFDTETTGLRARGGDRLVEIGGVELINGIQSGRSYHVYINPERSMPPEAFAVHGLSEEFLRDKPRFAEIVDEFLAFIDGGVLVIHNAEFDMGFINMELGRLGREAVPMSRVIDTLQIARRKHPAGPNTLDALCARYKIDNSMRTRHGALLDAELLAEVYVELMGGRQAALGLADDTGGTSARRGFTPAGGVARARPRPEPLPSFVTSEERAAHQAFVALMGEKALWNLWPDEQDASLRTASSAGT